MTIKKRILSLMVCITLMITCLPMNVFAAGTPYENAETSAVSKASNAAPVLKACYNSSNGADLRWKKVPGAAGYYIYRNRKADGGTKQVGKVNGENTLHFYDTQVKSGCWGHVYTYFVRAFYKNGDLSKKSNVMTFIRLAPMKFTSCSAVSPYAIQLTWKCAKSVNNASGYQIQYARTKSDLKSGTGTFNKKVISKKSTMKAIIKGLSANTRYYFRIRSYRNYTTKSGEKKKAWSQYSSIVSAKTAPKSTTTHYRALLIGNSLYPDPDDLLEGPYNDTEAMAGTLRNYGYTTKIKRNRYSYEILGDIRSTFADADDSDVSLFYYSGHGSTRTGSLVGVDDQYLSLDTLASVLKDIPGKVIIILDSCGSGGGIINVGDSADGNPEKSEDFYANAFNQMVVNAFAGADPGYTSPSADADVPMVGYGELRNSKFLVITGAAAEEAAKDVCLGDIWGGAMTRTFTAGAGCNFLTGTFTGAIPADSNGDNKLTLKEMYNYLDNNIIYYSYQHVMCYPNGSSSVIMVKN